MKKVIALIGAVAIAVLASQLGGFFTKTAIFEGQKALYSQEKLEADLIESLPQSMAALKKAFPDDYEAMITDVHKGIKKSANTDQITASTAEATSAVRKKYSATITKAPSADILALLDGNIQLIEEVRTGEGDATCAAVAVQGPNAVTSKGITKYNNTIDKVGALMFRALRAGIETPIDREPASDADWAIIVEALQASGMTDEELGVVGQVAQNDPRYCSLILDFLREVRNANGEVGDRVRAAFAEEAAKG